MGFESFYYEIEASFQKKFLVSDKSMFRNLMHTFYIIANKEKTNIQRNKAQDIEPTLPKKMKKRDRKEAIHNSMESEEPSGISSMIPGFSIIKNSIITPLLMSTERLVEYILPEKEVSEEDRAEEES